MTNTPKKATYAPSTSIIQVINLCLMQVCGFMHNSLLPGPWTGKSYAYSRVCVLGVSGMSRSKGRRCSMIVYLHLQVHSSHLTQNKGRNDNCCTSVFNCSAKKKLWFIQVCRNRLKDEIGNYTHHLPQLHVLLTSSCYIYCTCTCT